jgi:predicted Zn finger-like uncharacterized protein
MLVVKCPGCAARYRVPEKLRSKTVKCRRCGKAFRIAAPPPQPETDEDLLGALAQGEVQARSEVAAVPSPSAGAAPSAPVFPDREWSPTSVGPVEEPVPTGFAHYLRDVGRSLLFFTRTGNLVTFIIVLFVVLLRVPLSYAGCVGLLGAIIVEGWYMAYRLNVVLGAAAGEQELPNLTLGDVWEGIILPLLKWLAASVAALLPFIIGLIYLLVLGVAVGGAFRTLVDALFGKFLEALEEQGALGWVRGGVLLLLPQLLWPMMVLVVAVGGIRCLVRFDLMLVTIFKTFPAYALVVVLTLIGVVGPGLLPVGEGLGVAALLIAVEVYTNVFAMRVIGLYYHHFKKGFAWSWG